MTAHDYETLASRAREKAHFAMHQGNPKSAFEWITVAVEADRAKAPPIADLHIEMIQMLERIAESLEALVERNEVPTT